MRRNLSSLATLMYPRVHGCTLASKVPLLYMGFVHCGGAFHTPTHYGTRVLSKNCRRMYTSRSNILSFHVTSIRPGWKNVKRYRDGSTEVLWCCSFLPCLVAFWITLCYWSKIVVCCYSIVQVGLVGVCGSMWSGQHILSLPTVYAAVYDTL